MNIKELLELLKLYNKNSHVFLLVENEPYRVNHFDGIGNDYIEFFVDIDNEFKPIKKVSNLINRLEDKVSEYESFFGNEKITVIFDNILGDVHFEIGNVYLNRKNNVVIKMKRMK